MIEFVLVYFVGKSFYDLAKEHNRNKWVYAILGVIAYYGGLFIGGIVIALVYELGMDKSIDDINDILLGIMAIPIGVSICWAFYKILKSNWSRSTNRAGLDNILDADVKNDH
jgi:hypothetical protein